MAANIGDGGVLRYRGWLLGITMGKGSIRTRALPARCHGRLLSLGEGIGETWI